MTEELFATDSYLKTCDATVIKADERGVVLDRTVFYARSGGQPGDSGVLGGIKVVDTFKDRDSGDYVHVLAAGEALPAVGDTVTAEIDWERRHKHMRMHSCLHLLCAVVDGGVTGGSIGEAKSRLDFDLPDTSLDKEQITADLNRLIEENHPVAFSTITDDELSANSELVRTMSVKPPQGSHGGQGAVRIIDITGVDLQPCGGTHVKSTGEIGRVRVGKIENKGKHNRRINIHLEE